MIQRITNTTPCNYKNKEDNMWGRGRYLTPEQREKVREAKKKERDFVGYFVEAQRNMKGRESKEFKLKEDFNKK